MHIFINQIAKNTPINVQKVHLQKIKKITWRPKTITLLFPRQALQKIHKGGMRLKTKINKKQTKSN